MKTLLTIGNVAKKTGITSVSIRYYERIKLIPKAARSISGYRLYPSKIIPTILFIKKAQSLGFNLNEIKALLNLYEMNEKNSMNVRYKVENKLIEVKQKIHDLQALESSLSHLLASCDGTLATSCCPILQNIFNVTQKHSSFSS